MYDVDACLLHLDVAFGCCLCDCVCVWLAPWLGQRRLQYTSQVVVVVVLVGRVAMDMVCVQMDVGGGGA